MKYNTNEERLRLPQYGRGVQKMVDEALTITNRQKRQDFAERIVEVMALLNPDMLGQPDPETIFWNHLAYMANYELDIDYPCDIEHKDPNAHPTKLAYPGHRIHYRHYGHLVEQALEHLRELPEGNPMRRELTQLVTLRMKRYLSEARGGANENEKVARDVEQYTEGRVSADEAYDQLAIIERRVRALAPPPRASRGKRRR